MKKNALRNLVYSFILSLFLCVSEASPDIPIKVRGLAKLGGNYIFSIQETATNKSKWIEKNQAFSGFKVIDYDEISLTIKGLYNDQAIMLTLVESELTTIATKTKSGGKGKQIVYSQVEINQLVHDFKQKEFTKLPNEKDPLFHILRQSAENRIHSYKNHLLSLNGNNLTENIEFVTEEKTESSRNKPRIGSQRKQNSVNSRIWASDHIEEFGLPST